MLEWLRPRSDTDNKSAKGADKWSSLVCQSICTSSEYGSLSVTMENSSSCNIFKAIDIVLYDWNWI